MNRIKINAPAKINIGLNVVNKREDGFHDLETMFFPILDLFDTIEFSKSNKISISSNNELLNSEKDNLIIKAIHLLEKSADCSIAPNIKLHKKIPIGAGLGGGSSDAAATLLAISKLYELNLSKDIIIDLALKLGSDVPFFLENKPAIANSRGEKLSPVDLIKNFSVLIINPPIHISTKMAFKYVNPKPINYNYTELFSNKILDFSLLQKTLVNDFEEYIFKEFPKIKTIKTNLLSSGAKLAMMSGTGSTVFGIFDEIHLAENAAKNFDDNYFIFLSTL